ncbi:MAG: tetratricopeptide repeat protein, partial [Polyangiaceae bacterium]|nr:tetratricopeptide repeat protein [Polyangiaceae bacterium]
VAAERFAAGEKAYADGDFVRAAESFEAAYASDPQPAALWNAARSWHRGGEPARAANLYHLSLRETPGGAADRDEATRALVELTTKLGRLEIVAPGATVVEVDQKATRSSSVFVNPGSHLVEATIEGERVRQEVTIDPGAAKTVLLERTPPPRAEPPPPSPPGAQPKPTAPAPRDHGGVTPWVLAPFAGATALAGALTIASGVDTLIARGQYLDIPEDERTQAQYDDGKFKQDRTNVLIGVTAGLALVTGAVAVFAIDWGEGTLVGFAPDGVRAHVRF